MARSSIPNLNNALRMFLLRTYGKIAPQRFQKRFVQNFSICWITISLKAVNTN